MFGRFHDIAASVPRVLDLRGEADQTNLAHPLVLQDEEEARRFTARIMRDLKERGGYDEADVYMVVRDDQGKESLTAPFRGCPCFKRWGLRA
jgi:hypothetical protein